MPPRRVATIPMIAAFALPALLSCRANPDADQAEAHGDDQARERSQAVPAVNSKPKPIPDLREFPLPAGPGSYAPALVAAGEQLYFAWYERVADGEIALRFARHDGQAWGPTQTLVTSATIGFDARLPPSLGTIGELTVYVGWAERTPSGLTSFRLSRSRGAGKRWEPPKIAFESTDFAPVAPTIVPDGARTATLSWLESTGAGPRLHQLALPESDAVPSTKGGATTVPGDACDCCRVAASGSSAGQLLLSRSDDARRLSLHTRGGEHLVAAADPELSCTDRYLSLATAGSTLAVAWSDASPEIAACVAFSNSPKTWPPCARLGGPGQHPVGDLVLLNPDTALLTFAEAADDSTAKTVTARAMRRDGVLGTERAVATVPACPADACGRMRTVNFGDRVVWAWVDPGVEGQSRIRAAIAPASATSG